ncbi:EAL domain-containing protein [Thalassotalea sp. HSM 43]|uniref:EAL and HDOD domain-containing protein n=1 Tax=Thalassotalea sp. HSM 43 TaxID=2552945 RepID=UPI001080B438|nr:EAL domain-containing protein [Thalassotalea sp. HSM 43]QBY03345.1 EAL domain-containing protein [Thalassotalea sp. HSM 43]
MPSFAARQAIVDKQQQIIAYELLFRDSMINVYPKVDAHTATQKLLHTALQSSQSKTFTQQKPAFINFTTETLQKGYPFKFDNRHIVVEILETEEPTQQLLSLCQELHQQGYEIALDDFINHQQWHAFFPYISIIKVDFRQTSTTEILQLIEHITNYPNIKLLAEKIENKQEFEHASRLGFEYFQGYFIDQPEVMKSRPHVMDEIGLELDLA